MKYTLLFASIVALQPAVLALPRAGSSQRGNTLSPAPKSGSSNVTSIPHPYDDGSAGDGDDETPNVPKSQVAATEKPGNVIINNDTSGPRESNATINGAPARNVTINSAPAGNVTLKDTVAPSRNVTLQDTVAPSRNVTLQDTVAPSRNVTLQDTVAPSGNASVPLPESSECTTCLAVKDKINPKECIDQVKTEAKSLNVKPETVEAMSTALKNNVKDGMTPDDGYKAVAAVATELQKAGGNQTDIPTLQICMGIVMKSVFRVNIASEILLSMTVGMAASGEKGDAIRSSCKQFDQSLKEKKLPPAPVQPGGRPNVGISKPNNPGPRPAGPAGPAAPSMTGISVPLDPGPRPDAGVSKPKTSAPAPKDLLNNPRVMEIVNQGCTKPACRSLTQSMIMSINMKIDIRISMAIFVGVRALAEEPKLGRGAPDIATQFFNDCVQKAKEVGGDASAKKGAEIVQKALPEINVKPDVAAKIEDKVQKAAPKAELVPAAPKAEDSKSTSPKGYPVPSAPKTGPASTGKGSAGPKPGPVSTDQESPRPAPERVNKGGVPNSCGQ